MNATQATVCLNAPSERGGAVASPRPLVLALALAWFGGGVAGLGLVQGAAAAGLAPASALGGDTASEPAALPAVVVTATRSAQSAFDVAASVDAVSASQIRSAGPLVNLSEALSRVPGLVVQNRQNYAQDLQISSRGFGSRASFGVRGVRLYADGIPATMPDGQGQSSSFDLGSAQRIEVLRGPASALYGNASGGVVQVFTEDGPPTPEATVELTLGRDGLQREAVKAGGESGRLNYLVDVSRFSTDGYRDHSAAERQQLHAKLRWTLADRETLTFVGSYLNMPGVEDPLGLTAPQLAADRRQAGANALAYNTRKNIENTQAGLIYERPTSFGEVRMMGYAGSRKARQYQAIPANATQALATNPGGIIDLDRLFGGLDARATWRTQLAGKPLSLTGGLSLDRMDEQRQGFENFTGLPAAPTALGVEGRLKRDEDNRATNNDQYLQAQWDFAEQWVASAGLRHSQVRFNSEDHYITAGNGDDSGGMGFSATTPMASLMWRLQPGLRLYATAGRSFETPTLNEVAYREGTTGWNTALKASHGQHFELGAKTQLTAKAQLNVAVFHVDTDDEIAVKANSGGRSVFQNVGRTRRDGLEGSLDWRVVPGVTAYASASWTRAEYRDAFPTSTAQVQPGRALPGVPRRNAYAEVVWRPAALSGWHTALEWRHSGRVWANDANDAYAPSYSLLALRTGWRQAMGAWRLDALARIDNLNDTHYVGSVIVNEANGRYYEPAPGRSATVGVQVTRGF